MTRHSAVGRTGTFQRSSVWSCCSACAARCRCATAGVLLHWHGIGLSPEPVRYHRTRFGPMLAGGGAARGYDPGPTGAGPSVPGFGKTRGDRPCPCHAPQSRGTWRKPMCPGHWIARPHEPPFGEPGNGTACPCDRQALIPGRSAATGRDDGRIPKAGAWRVPRCAVVTQGCATGGKPWEKGLVCLLQFARKEQSGSHLSYFWHTAAHFRKKCGFTLQDPQG